MGTRLDGSADNGGFTVPILTGATSRANYTRFRQSRGAQIAGSSSWHDAEVVVAGQRAGGGGDDDGAGVCAGGDDGGHVGIGYDFELGR
ncbi:MAG TPA: hypothetical protein VI386_20835 [Candidatus Sulfotelmatobacter sp.]